MSRTRSLKKITRSPSDRSQEVTVTLTEEQLNAIVEALHELDLIIRYSYNHLSSDDKRFAKVALKKIRRSKALNCLEWAQFS